MNQNIVRVVIATLMGLVGAVMMFTAISSGGNVIGSIARYGMAICFLIGLLTPKGGVFLMLVLAGYSDLLKRLMVLETKITMLDLTFVLGMAPMALAGCVVACFLRKVFLERFETRDMVTFGIATLFLAAGAALGLRGEGGMRALRVVADYGAFSFLLFVLPIVFPNRNALIRFAKFAVLLFVPVAIYGIWQRVFGLADFELAYLLTGLSVESRQLGDVEVRPFSTLNAASSLTMVMAICVMLTLLLRREGSFGWPVTLLFSILFTAACYMTFTRVGWGVLVISLLLIPILRYRLTTFLMYAGGIAGFVALVMASDFLMDRLPKWQDELYGESVSSDSEAQALRVMTLSDRLIGFSNMKNPDNWQPFGVEERGRQIEGLSARYSTTFSHDGISRFLFNFGYIPFFGAIGTGLVMLYIVHRKIFSLPKDAKRSAQFALAGVFGALCSLGTGGTAFQFPANVFLWIMVSYVVVCIREGSSAAARVPAGRTQEVNDARHRNPMPRLARAGEADRAGVQRSRLPGNA